MEYVSDNIINTVSLYYFMQGTPHIFFMFSTLFAKKWIHEGFVSHLFCDQHCAQWNVMYNVIGHYRYSVNICWIHKLHSFFCPHGRLIFLNTLEVYIFIVFAFCQVEHLHNFILFRFSMGFIDSIIAKCKYALKEIVEWNLWGKWGVIDVFQS